MLRLFAREGRWVMATVADVAKWHRRYEQAALDAARSAHFGYVAGCEDALFVAHGWRKQSEMHAEFALALELVELEHLRARVAALETVTALAKDGA